MIVPTTHTIFLELEIFRLLTDLHLQNHVQMVKIPDRMGGGVFIDYGAYETSPITFINSGFTSNDCNGNGGAIYVDDMASQLEGTYCSIESCDFTSNTTTYRGGAIGLYNTNNFATIVTNTFTSN